ncbi:manganese and iron superoxide dismutase [Desulforamulus reducens MI-1]|uniref:superoxide dismutase n=1 Tax=Desulforamulus reducens (strain ATCC BAA-1160 / DSM 100696 / MI-1) TaxID=349161 RepID=A4J6B5_DESRM|nr:manganese and iron superoxide dismutase [Desulforamulus reducens MI-1]
MYIPDCSDGTFCPIEARSLKPQLLSMMGFSPRQIQEHYKIYQSYITKTNEVRMKLRSIDMQGSNSIHSSYRSLKIDESQTVANGKLHEMYFDNLGGNGRTAIGKVLEIIVKDFGSYEFWERDFRSTGLASQGWVILGYDFDDCHLHNYTQGAPDVVPIVRFEPLLVLDVCEHAYFLDYGTNRNSYIDAFFRNIDWYTVNSRLQNLKSTY